MLPKLSFLAGSLCVSSLLLAIPSAQAGCVSGKATDTSGVAIANASLTLQQPGSQTRRQVFTDQAGAFEVCDLDPGQYQITTEHDGFASLQLLATVTADNSPFLEFHLAPAAAKAAPNTTETTEPAASEPAAITPAYEFRYQAVPDNPETIPNSPASASGSHHAPHGKAEAFFGAGLPGQPSEPLNRFPLSELSASIGGDLNSARTSYFVAFDQFGMDSQRMVNEIAAAQARAMRPFSSANANVLTYSSLDARVDHRFSAHDTAFARVRGGDIHTGLAGRAADGSPKLVDTRHITQVSATVANTAEISPSTVNQTSVQYTLNDASLPAGAPEVGIQSGLPTTRRDRVLEAADNVYRQVGGQSLRFGGDFLFNQMSVSFIESTMGYQADSSFSQSSRGAGLYIQSQRQVRPNLLLTSGVRYEIQPIKGLRTDTNNLTPQLGFAWSPSSRTVIRGGGAIYYDQMPLTSIAASPEADGSADIQNFGAFANHSGSPAAQLASFTLVSPLIQNSYVESASFGIEQRLSAHTVVSSDYRYARGVQLAMPMFRSALLCATPAQCRAGDSFRGAEQGTGAESSYQGLSASFTQEPVRWGNYRVTYTRSSASGSGTEGNGTYISDNLRSLSFMGALHTSADAASNWRQRLSHGYVLSGSADYSSRSEFTGINFINVNARLTKTLAWGQHYRFDALAETFNSMQRTNAAFARSFANAGDPAPSVFSVYRSIASMQGPTIAQFGLRLGF